MIEATADVIVWMVRNWELVLVIFGSMIVIGLIMQEKKKTELMSWSDEKLEARRSYLLAHEKPWSSSTEVDMVWREIDRRSKIRHRQSTNVEWEKYK